MNSRQRNKNSMSTISKQLEYIREATRASAASSTARHNVEARNAKTKKSMQVRNEENGIH
jgi:hypothetical protein